MFGYVMPVKCEMRVRDFEAYRASYCGVCKELGRRYGVFSRLLLNYDLVLLALLADALSGEEGDMRREGCFVNPVAKRATLHDTAGLALAGDGLILLSYHKLRDNLADEGFFRRLGIRFSQPYLSLKYRRAAGRRPELAQMVAAQMAAQMALEQSALADVDAACEPTGRMCEALFAAAAQNEAQRPVLARLGLFAGQIVYLLDAAEDYEEDTQKNRYNVFVCAGMNKEQAVEAARRRCRMAAGEIALCYNLLDIKKNKDILDNIFFLGLPAGIAQAGKKRGKGSPGHGQIESV